MNDLERAILEVADIRARLVASTQFRGIAPLATASIGALALLVTIAQSLWPQWLAVDARRYVIVWGIAFLCFLTLASLVAVPRCRKLHQQLAAIMLNASVRLILPFAAAGIVLTSVVIEFAPDTAWLLPGAWLLLIALTGFSSAASLPAGTVWASAWYFVSGSVVLIVAGSSHTLSPWMMGVPLTVGQLIVAFIMHHYDDRSDRAPYEDL